MAVATAPNYYNAPFYASGLISAANTNRDGTGSTVTIKAGAAGGSKVERIRVQARDATTAGMVRLFLWDGASTYRLVGEVSVSAVTPSGTVRAFYSDTDVNAELDFSVPERLMVIPSGWSLIAATHNAEAFFVNVWGVE